MNCDQPTFSDASTKKAKSIPLSGSKRMFPYLRLEPNLPMKEALEEDSLLFVSDSSSEASDAADRTIKRSRMDSPVANEKKAPAPEPESSPDSPIFLPIIQDADLPDPTIKNIAPDQYLIQLVKAQFGLSLKPKSGLELDDGYFASITEEQLAAYTLEVLTPARDNDVKTLRKLVEERGSQVVNCTNRFGESLLNLACRRGFTELAEFLLSKDVELNVRIKDDFGRTPLHDACWHPTPQLDICTWLIKKDPSLLLITDKRGNTPFQYARSEDWQTWRQFLFDNRDSLQLLTEPSTLKRFT